MHLVFVLSAVAGAMTLRPHLTPLVHEGGFAAPGAWVAVIRGRPWICWDDPSRTGNPHDIACWHELVELRHEPATRTCEWNDDETGPWPDSMNMDEKASIHALDAMHAMDERSSGDGSDRIDQANRLDSTCFDDPRTSSGWAFAFAGPRALWIRTPRGQTYLGTALAHRHTTHLQRSSPPALLPLQAPRRLDCAIHGWLAQHRAGSWSWSAQPCEALATASRLRAPALQQKRQLMLRMRLHVEAQRELGDGHRQAIEPSLAGAWSFSFALHFRFAPRVDATRHLSLPF